MTTHIVINIGLDNDLPDGIKSFLKINVCILNNYQISWNWSGTVDSELVLLLLMSCGPFYQHGLTLIPAWRSNHMSNKMWDEITYPFLNFNGATVEV